MESEEAKRIYRALHEAEGTARCTRMTLEKAELRCRLAMSDLSANLVAITECRDQVIRQQQALEQALAAALEAFSGHSE